jgi:hypothetical protein
MNNLLVNSLIIVFFNKTMQINNYLLLIIFIPACLRLNSKCEKNLFILLQVLTILIVNN